VEHVIKCRHCGAAHAYEHPSAKPSMIEQFDAPGCVMVWDVNDGLKPIWLCRECGSEVVAAWRRIVEVCGTDALSFSGVLRNYDRRARECGVTLSMSARPSDLIHKVLTKGPARAGEIVTRTLLTWSQVDAGLRTLIDTGLVESYNVESDPFERFRLRSRSKS
jgi:hypothetical protein